MSNKTKNKYAELIMDIAAQERFRMNDMRTKHKVSTRVFTVMRSMNIIKKVGDGHNAWCADAPTQAMINLIAKQCRQSSRIEKVLAKQVPTQQLTIKPIRKAPAPAPMSVNAEPECDTTNSKMMLILGAGLLIGFMIATIIWK
jgi:hypothetical protein